MPNPTHTPACLARMEARCQLNLISAPALVSDKVAYALLISERALALPCDCQRLADAEAVYEKLHKEVDDAEKDFLKALKELSGSKRDLRKEISSTFMKKDSQFPQALVRIKEEMRGLKQAPFADIKYDQIFDDRILEFLSTQDFKIAIRDYIKKYNELLQASTYFKKGIFNYYNATTIAKNLADNGFFEAKHTVTLNAETPRVVTTRAELEKVIEDEKVSILNDVVLRKKYDEVRTKIEGHRDLRAFGEYISNHETILPHLENIGDFKEQVWKSYFKTKIDLYDGLIEKYQQVDEREKEILREAEQQRTQWETAIETFNRRFHVPFT